MRLLAGLRSHRPSQPEEHCRDGKHLRQKRTHSEGTEPIRHDPHSEVERKKAHGRVGGMISRIRKSECSREKAKIPNAEEYSADDSESIYRCKQAVMNVSSLNH